MSNYVININNLSKTTREKKILDNINLQIESGKIYGIIGRNGSGKTMLFKAICGLIKPTSGELFVFDQAIHKGNLPIDTGMIIENPRFLLQYSGMKNLKMLASINNVIDEEEIKRTIELVGLDPEDKTPVKKYSLGMKQRLGIAQAIMENPKLLILDEPMNSLDEDGVELIRSILLDLKKQSVTILIASHIKEDIETLCDEVYIMSKGKLEKK